MWNLRSFIKPYWAASLLAPLLMLLEVVMDLLQPRLMAAIVNQGVNNGDLNMIWSSGLTMLGVALIGLIGGVGCTIFANHAAQGFGADLRIQLYARIQSLSFNQLDQFQTGSLITRLTGDVVQMINLLHILLRQFAREGFLFIGSIIMAFLISPRLSLILAAAIPLQLIILFILMRYATPLFRTLQQRLDQANTVLQENSAGIRVVKAFVRSAFERARFGRANSDYLETGLKSARVVGLNGPLITLLLNLGIVAVLWYGADLTWNAGMPIGDLAAFIIYIGQALYALASISNTLMSISRAKVSGERIHEVLTAEQGSIEIMQAVPQDDALTELLSAASPAPTVAQADRLSQAAAPATASHAANEAAASVERTLPLSPYRAHGGSITFDNVSFAYSANPDKPVLRQISFTAEPGQTIGILGATGSGKSTLVNLIPRLYDVTEGSIRIDGVDVRDVPADRLRSQIGMVLQQSFLFSGTIRDNIRFSKPAADEAEIVEAAAAAEADRFIRNLPDGYDAILGQRGVNLSGGQKQRLSLARALMMKPSVLILDDSTSAIDLGTERRIQHALQSLMRQSTCLIIAQRISSVIHADRIIVLDQGRIAAQGTHDELLAQSAIYQAIYHSQQTEPAAGRQEAVDA
ncbi:ABC transporter ATP-binding protein [Paenibacillaceae bacterium]|nr:ABC transporter ATP-binding protein [Paenibacillaceae bacterium]